MIILTALLAFGLPVAALLMWNRLPGPSFVRTAERLSLVVLAQGFAVLLALVSVNDQYLFYTSWNDLLGKPPTTGIVTAIGGRPIAGPQGNVSVFTATDERQTDGGRLITEEVRGERSHLTGRVLIHLPAGYASNSTAYPVVELLQGWHAPPESWIKNLHVLDAMNAAEKTGQFGKVITVMPDINIAAPRDTECTDVPHGPQVQTWLSTDIRDLVLSSYRVLPGPHSFALMGFSTGGYCAAKLAFLHPSWYGEAVVISGYFDAVKDNTTGDLWGGSRSLRDENDLSWLVSHRKPPPISLLAFASRHDSESYPSTARFLKLAHAPLQIFSLIEPTGGHNFTAIRAALPMMFAWLGAQLRGTPTKQT